MMAQAVSTPDMSDTLGSGRHPFLLMDVLERRQGHICQPETAKPEEAAEAEHHVVKAARKDELSPRLTSQGQALLQASRAATRAVQPSAGSMREAYLHSLNFKCAPVSL